MNSPQDGILMEDLLRHDLRRHTCRDSAQALEDRVFTMTIIQPGARVVGVVRNLVRRVIPTVAALAMVTFMAGGLGCEGNHHGSSPTPAPPPAITRLTAGGFFFTHRSR